MRASKRTIAIVGAGVVLAGLAVSGGAWLVAEIGRDSVTVDYATYEEAAADRLFDRGWLPAFIPASATGISMRNDLDRNRSRGEFRYDPADTERFLEQLRPYRGRESPIADFQARLQDLQTRNYWPYEHQEYGFVWVFFINPERGHVIYNLWPAAGVPATR